MFGLEFPYSPPPPTASLKLHQSELTISFPINVGMEGTFLARDPLALLRKADYQDLAGKALRHGDGWTTFSSNDPSSGFSGGKGVVVDRQNRIYMSDNGNHRIMRINDMSGAGCVTFGSYGNGIGRFNQPEALNMDSFGRIYIPDESNHRIVRINSMAGDGWVSFGSYGHGPGQFYLPHDVAVDNLGRIYIADTANQRIVRINSMAGDGWVELARGAAMASDISGPFLLSAPKGMRVLGSGPSLTCIQQYFRRWRSAADIAHPSSE